MAVLRRNHHEAERNSAIQAIRADQKPECFLRTFPYLEPTVISLPWEAGRLFNAVHVAAVRRHTWLSIAEPGLIRGKEPLPINTEHRHHGGQAGSIDAPKAQALYSERGVYYATP